MEKVKLPREVAEAIEYIRESAMSEHALYDRAWLTSGIDDTTGIRKAKDTILNYIVFDGDRFNVDNQLIRYYKAIVNGYEVEQTPEDKVRELHREWAGKQAKAYHERDELTHKSSSMFIRGMMATLEALGMTIDQVNDITPIEGVNA